MLDFIKSHTGWFLCIIEVPQHFVLVLSDEGIVSACGFFAMMHQQALQAHGTVGVLDPR